MQPIINIWTSDQNFLSLWVSTGQNNHFMSTMRLSPQALAEGTYRGAHWSTPMSLVSLGCKQLSVPLLQPKYKSSELSVGHPLGSEGRTSVLSDCFYMSEVATSKLTDFLLHFAFPAPSMSFIQTSQHSHKRRKKQNSYKHCH